MIKPILFFFAVNIYFFLCFAFVNAQINPFMWELKLRALCLFLSAFAFFIGHGVYNDIKTNK